VEWEDKTIISISFFDDVNKFICTKAAAATQNVACCLHLDTSF